MTVPIITFFTEPKFEGTRYFINDWNSNVNVMIHELPDNFVVKSMRIDTRLYVLFFETYFDLYTNFLRELYTGNISNVVGYSSNRVRITLVDPFFKPIFPKNIDPLTEYYHMTNIDNHYYNRHSRRDVYLYTDYYYKGKKLILMGEYFTIMHHYMTQIMVVGVLPDNYEVKSIKLQPGLKVQLFENMADFILNDRPYYTQQQSDLYYNFKYNPLRHKHKYIKIIYRNTDSPLNLVYDIGNKYYNRYMTDYDTAIRTDTQDIQTIHDTHDILDTQDTQDIQTIHDTHDILDTQDTQDIQTIHDTHDIQIIQDAHDINAISVIEHEDEVPNFNIYNIDNLYTHTETTIQPTKNSTTDIEKLPNPYDHYITNTDITNTSNDYDNTNDNTKSIIPISQLYEQDYSDFDNDNKKGNGNKNKNNNENENNFFEFYVVIGLIGILIFVVIVVRVFK